MTISNPQALKNFKKRALANKKEVLAIVIGTLLHENGHLIEIRLEDLVYPVVEATEDSVEWKAADVITLQAHVLPKHVLGTLHSHPDVTMDACITPQDIMSMQHTGETIMGIYSWWLKPDYGRKKAQLDWYFGACKL